MIDRHLEPTQALKEAKQRRAEARAVHEQAELALARDKLMDTNALVAMTKLEEHVGNYHKSLGQDLAERLAKGESSDVPLDTSDSLYRLTAVRQMAAVAAEAVKSLQSKVDAANAELDAAEHAVAREAAIIVAAKVEDYVVAIEKQSEILSYLESTMMGLMPPGEWPTPRIQAILDRIERSKDIINIPVNELHASRAVGFLRNSAIAQLSADDEPEEGQKAA